MLITQRGVIFLTDTYVTVDPTAEEIAEMTMLAAEEIRRFGIEPKAALLSHSNFGSRDSPSALKMREAAAILKRVAPGTDHATARCMAIRALSEIAAQARLSRIRTLKGEANLLVFPNLDAANITTDDRQADDGCAACRADPARHRQAGAYPDAVGDLARRRQHDGAGRRGERAQGAGAVAKPDWRDGGSLADANPHT